MTTFILVHGTFAKQAAWTRTDSPLGIRLAGLAAETGQTVRIRAVEWSGRNLERDRWAAAKAIADQISRCRDDFPSEEIFLIGHSHGGSAIAYFMKSQPELRTAVAGCAFLSTPFLALRLRPFWETWFLAIAVAVATATTIVAALIVQSVVWHFEVLDGLVIAVVLASTVCLQLLATVVAAVVWRERRERIKESIREKLISRISRSETADLPPGSYLFLRASGDEAAALLGFGQFISWAMGKAAGVFNKLLFWGFGKLQFRSRTAVVAINSVVALFILFTMALFFLVIFFLIIFRVDPDYWQTVWELLTGVWIKDFGLNAVGSMVLAAIWIVFLLASTGAIVYSAIVFSTLLLGSLALRLMGWVSLIEALFAEVSVEATPYGQHEFIHVSWKDDHSDLASLNHSLTYLNPRALDCLIHWISGLLIARAARPILPSAQSGRMQV